MYHHISKHLKVRQKYAAARRIFNSLLGVWECDETRSLVFDILLLSSLKNSHTGNSCYYNCYFDHNEIYFLSQLVFSFVWFVCCQKLTLICLLLVSFSIFNKD